ncbi:MAG: hypothetical protein ACTSU2_11955 [Promethearchaeota archaeon]
MDGKTHVVGGLQLYSLFIIILWFAIPESNPSYAFFGITLPSSAVIFYGRIINIVLWLIWLIVDQMRIYRENMVDEKKEYIKLKQKELKEAESRSKKLKDELNEIEGIGTEGGTSTGKKKKHKFLKWFRKRRNKKKGDKSSNISENKDSEDMKDAEDEEEKKIDESNEVKKLPSSESESAHHDKAKSHSVSKEDKKKLNKEIKNLEKKIEERKKELEKEGKKVGKIKKEKTRSMKVSLILTLINAVLLSLLVKINVSHRFGIIIMGYLMAFVGAAFPDLDLWISMGSHRSPITHSAFLPSIIVFYFLFFFDPTPTDAETFFIFTGFIVGYASHLIFDLYKKGTLFVSAIKKTLMGEDYVPGDIRKLPSSLERFYLVYAGSFLIGLLVLSMLRISASTGFYPTLKSIFGYNSIVSSSWSAITPYFKHLFYILIGLYIFPFIVLLDNYGRKKEKKKWKFIAIFYYKINERRRRRVENMREYIEKHKIKTIINEKKEKEDK